MTNTLVEIAEYLKRITNLIGTFDIIMVFILAIMVYMALKD